MKKIKYDLDTKIIDLNDENIKYYNLDKKYLYSYDKLIKPLSKSSKSLSSKPLSKKFGGNKIISTFHSLPSYEENEKSRKIIENFDGIKKHIPFDYDGTIYYMEIAGRSDRLIISISSDKKHKNELLHISLISESFFHITFIHNRAHYKLYLYENPSDFEDIIKFVYYNYIYYIYYIIENISTIDTTSFNDVYNNNWRNEILPNPDILRIFFLNLNILYAGLYYLFTISSHQSMNIRDFLLSSAD